MADTQAPRRPWLLGLKRKLTLAGVLAAVLLAAFFLGAAWSGREGEPVITSDLLGQQLQTVQELVSVEYHYTNMGKFENQVDFYGWKVPFTTKRFLVSYDGLIKAGVDLSGATVEVDEVQKSVTITLPESRILSHEIPEDSIQVFDETRNIFNPITIEDYTGFTRDQKAEVEQRAIDEGLLTGASEKAREAVETLAALLPGSGDYTWTIR